MHGTLAQGAATGPCTPTFFTPAEYTTLARLTDVIIPASTTPSASNAGVPEYIYCVVSMNTEHQGLVRSGLVWLGDSKRARGMEKATWNFRTPNTSPSSSLSATKSIASSARRSRSSFARTRIAASYDVAINEKSWPASAAVSTPSRAEVNADDPASPVRLFRLMKNLTADGYYTSRIGLVDELGYTGNTALASFPSCTIREH